MNSTINDHTTPRNLTMDELWKSWPVGQNYREDWYQYGKYFLGPAGLGDQAKAPNDYTFPIERTDYQLTNPLILEWEHLRRRRKINLAMTSIFNYSPLDENRFVMHDHPPFTEAWETAKSEEEREISVDRQIELATIQKDEANKIFRERDWQNAWYLCGKAWLTLLPYHIDAFPIGSDERNSLAKIENMLFGNMMACALKSDRNDTHQPSARGEGYHAAIIAGQLLIEQRFGSTVGQLKKAFNRLNELRRRKVVLEGQGSDLTHIYQHLSHERLQDDLKLKTNPHEDLCSEDYRLAGSKALMLVPKWFWDMYPNDRIGSICIEDDL